MISLWKYLVVLNHSLDVLDREGSWFGRREVVSRFHQAARNRPTAENVWVVHFWDFPSNIFRPWLASGSWNHRKWKSNSWKGRTSCSFSAGRFVPTLQPMCRRDSVKRDPKPASPLSISEWGMFTHTEKAEFYYHHGHPTIHLSSTPLIFKWISKGLLPERLRPRSGPGRGDVFESTSVMLRKATTLSTLHPLCGNPAKSHPPGNYCPFCKMMDHFQTGFLKILKARGKPPFLVKQTPNWFPVFSSTWRCGCLRLIVCWWLSLMNCLLMTILWNPWPLLAADSQRPLASRDIAGWTLWRRGHDET